MSHLESHPIPDHWHDADGNHVRPTIPEWRRNPGNHVVRGTEVERDQRQKAVFNAHLAEHHRLGQPANVIEEF